MRVRRWAESSDIGDALSRGLDFLFAGFQGLPGRVRGGPRVFLLGEPSPDGPVPGFVEQRLGVFDGDKFMHRAEEFLFPDYATSRSESSRFAAEIALSNGRARSDNQADVFP